MRVDDVLKGHGVGGGGNNSLIDYYRKELNTPSYIPITLMIDTRSSTTINYNYLILDKDLLLRSSNGFREAETFSLDNEPIARTRDTFLIIGIKNKQIVAYTDTPQNMIGIYDFQLNLIKTLEMPPGISLDYASACLYRSGYYYVIVRSTRSRMVIIKYDEDFEYVAHVDQLNSNSNKSYRAMVNNSTLCVCLVGHIYMYDVDTLSLKKDYIPTDNIGNITIGVNDEDYFYILDHTNIKKFDNDGEVVASVAVPTGTRNPFSDNSAVIIDDKIHVMLGSAYTTIPTSLDPLPSQPWYSGIGNPVGESTMRVTSYSTMMRDWYPGGYLKAYCFKKDYNNLILYVKNY